MHERGIIHRDLKPENILFAEYCDSGTPKVCNFSLAKDRTNARFGTEIKSAAGDDDGNKVTTPCGTPGYVAPEILEQKRSIVSPQIPLNNYSFALNRIVMMKGLIYGA